MDNAITAGSTVGPGASRARCGAVLTAAGGALARNEAAQDGRAIKLITIHKHKLLFIETHSRGVVPGFRG